MLNRAALILRPRQPYLDWAKFLDDSGMIPDPEGDQAVYLIPVIESDQEVEEILKRIYSVLFERELCEWHTDESAWPKNRSLAMFKKWFKIEIHSIVEDLCGYPIEEEPDDN